MQEYDKQQAKLDKVGRKTTQTQPGAQAKLDLVHTDDTLLKEQVYINFVCLDTQLQRSLASAKADYERVHGRLMQDMPQLYENRLGYFDHCLHAVIKAQVRYLCDDSLC